MKVISQTKVQLASVNQNAASIICCCSDSGYTALVLFEYPTNGTLEMNLP